jgi:hypothetical protein
MLKSFLVDEELFYYSLSFDIDDSIGDGIWWLQIYDDKRELIYDKPFASSRGELDKEEILRIIRNQILSYKGAIL